MPVKSYRIRIVKDGIELEAEGDKSFVLDMIEQFSTTAGTTLSKATQGKRKRDDKSEKEANATKGTSIGEFIRQTGFKRHTDLVLAFGYFLEKFSGVSEFSAADINKCYYEAKLESSNTSQMIIQNARRAFMMEGKGKRAKGGKLYTLTRSGEEHIEKSLKSDSN